MKKTLFISALSALAISFTVCVSEVWAVCEAEEKAVEDACRDKTNRSACLLAQRALKECRVGIGNPEPTPTPGAPSGGTGPEGSFSGEFTSTKIRNKPNATGCETRTSIPGDLVVTANGKAKLNATFTDVSLSFRGKRTKKGFEVSAKTGKTKHKFVGKGLSAESATVDYSIIRKKGKTTECSAKYKGTLGRIQ